MNWVLEHLQILIAVAAAIAYFINRARGGTEENAGGDARDKSMPSAQTDEQAERTRRVQAEIRRKIAERRGLASESSPTSTVRERVPPLVRPVRTPPLDPFGGPMRKIVRELEEAAEKRLQPQPDPEESARAAALERQQRLAAELRALEAERLEQEQRAKEIAASVVTKSAKLPLAGPRETLGDKLRDPRELRRAVVLREILSVPVGMR